MISKSQPTSLIAKNPLLIGLLLCGLLTVLSACGKEEGMDVDSSGEIMGHVIHHEENIPSARVYIKYGGTEFPGIDPSAYDDSRLASSTDGRYHFENLTEGSYYLYATGYDHSIIDSVFGGVPVKITSSDEIVVIDVPVTE
ncbi:MAG: hypothetical protein AAF985_02490 [Bacteroidota bacterium]